MTRSRRDVLATAATLALGGALAGCAGDGGTTSTAADTPTATRTTTAVPTTDTQTTSRAPTRPTVRVRPHPSLGDILVDGSGMTLYAFTEDAAGESVCTGDCAEAWPPLTGDRPRSGDGVTATLETIPRPDGGAQVTAAGRPLYSFTRDDSPGDATGQALEERWYVLGPDGALKTAVLGGTETTRPTQTTTTPPSPTVEVRAHETYGEILVDGEGRTLYRFDSDEPGETNCYDSCATSWPPLVGGPPAAGDGVTAALGRIERTDGRMQVTAAEWPLYYYAGDGSPGDTTGQGVAEVWWVLAPDGSRITGAGGADAATATTAAGTTTGEPTATTTDGGLYGLGPRS